MSAAGDGAVKIQRKVKREFWDGGPEVRNALVAELREGLAAAVAERGLLAVGEPEMRMHCRGPMFGGAGLGCSQEEWDAITVTASTEVRAA